MSHFLHCETILSAEKAGISKTALTMSKELPLWRICNLLLFMWLYKRVTSLFLDSLNMIVYAFIITITIRIGTKTGYVVTVILIKDSRNNITCVLALSCKHIMYNSVHPWVTHYKGQSSWRTTGRRIFQSPWRQSSGPPRHLSPDSLRRIPDKPSRKTQTASSSGKYQEVRSNNHQTGINIKHAERCLV